MDKTRLILPLKHSNKIRDFYVNYPSYQFIPLFSLFLISYFLATLCVFLLPFYSLSFFHYLILCFYLHFFNPFYLSYILFSHILPVHVIPFYTSTAKATLIRKWRGRLQWAPKEVDVFRQILVSTDNIRSILTCCSLSYTFLIFICLQFLLVSLSLNSTYQFFYSLSLLVWKRDAAIILLLTKIPSFPMLFILIILSSLLFSSMISIFVIFISQKRREENENK